MNNHESPTSTPIPDGSYLSKKVIINGQTVTLYSLNGQTWLSSPEEIPEVMARLENTRILLNDPKAEGAAQQQPQQQQQASPAHPKPTAARYRMKGPKQRPILNQGGTIIEAPKEEPVSAADTEIRVGLEKIELVTRTAAAEGSREDRPIHIAPIINRVTRKDLAAKRAAEKAEAQAQKALAKEKAAKEKAERVAKAAADKAAVASQKAEQKRAEGEKKQAAQHKAQATKNKAAPAKALKASKMKPAKKALSKKVAAPVKVAKKSVKKAKAGSVKKKR